MTRRIKVAIVAPSLDILGGHAVQAQRLLKGWNNDPEIEAWLVPINPAPPRVFSRLASRRYVRTVINQLLYWPSLVRELRKADVVHVFSASYTSFLLAPLPAVAIARMYGKPVIVNYRSGEAPDHLERSAIARRVLRSVTLNVVPSSFLRDVFARFGIRSQVVSNVADLAQFRYRVRSPLGRRLVSTRNFEPLYNVACTLRAFVRVQARYPDASLTLVGSGSEDSTLRELARALGARNVAFAGRIPHDDIHHAYDAADLYVQTPSIDNMPGSVIEAFASGLPVVSTDVGGVPAILQHGVHGLLAPDNDDKAVADCITGLLENETHARQLATAALATCAAYEWPVIRNQWLAVYRSAVQAGVSRAAMRVEPA